MTIDIDTIHFKDLYINEEKIAKGTEDEREFTGVISSSDVDLMDEVLLPSGINLSVFKQNPVILLNHDRTGLPIGKSLKLRHRGNQIITTARIVGEGISEDADKVWKLIKGGWLRGLSVGFRKLEQRQPTPEDIKAFGKGVKNVISKWLMTEFSVVVNPCNSAALIESCKSLDIDPSFLLGENYIEEQIEKEVEKVEVSKEIKEKLVEVVKDSPKVDMKDVLKYFTDEVKKQIKINKGQLF